MFVAEQAGEIVGFSAILPRSDGETELDALFVEPSLWRKGIGRLLVDHCAQAARLRVIGNPHAEGFYLSSCFRAIGTVETRFGVGLVMRRML